MLVSCFFLAFSSGCCPPLASSAFCFLERDSFALPPAANNILNFLSTHVDKSTSLAIRGLIAFILGIWIMLLLGILFANPADSTGEALAGFFGDPRVGFLAMRRGFDLMESHRLGASVRKGPSGKRPTQNPSGPISNLPKSRLPVHKELVQISLQCWLLALLPSMLTCVLKPHRVRPQEMTRPQALRPPVH